MKNSHTTLLIVTLVVVLFGAGYLFVNRTPHPAATPTYSLSDVIGVTLEPGVVLYNLASGTKVPFVRISDLNADHPAEFHAGNIYLIRRTGNISTNDWTDELWKIDPSKAMSKLFSAQGLDFRVSNDQQWIAVTSGAGDSFHLHLLRQPNSFQSDFSLQQVTGSNDSNANVQLAGWTTDNIVWMQTDHAVKPQFVVLNPASSSFERYPLPENMPELPSDIALNIERGLVAFSTYPTFFDVESANSFRSQQTSVTLYAAKIASGEEKELAVGKGEPFKPTWADPTTVSYFDSATGTRKSVEVAF